jgi:hypothetical protein
MKHWLAALQQMGTQQCQSTSRPLRSHYLLLCWLLLIYRGSQMQSRLAARLALPLLLLLLLMLLHLLALLLHWSA